MLRLGLPSVETRRKKKPRSCLGFDNDYTTETSAESSHRQARDQKRPPIHDNPIRTRWHITLISPSSPSSPPPLPWEDKTWDPLPTNRVITSQGHNRLTWVQAPWFLSRSPSVIAVARAAPSGGRRTNTGTASTTSTASISSNATAPPPPPPQTRPQALQRGNKG